MEAAICSQLKVSWSCEYTSKLGTIWQVQETPGSRGKVIAVVSLWDFGKYLSYSKRGVNQVRDG